MGKVKIAVTPGFEVGGTIFRPEQLAVIGTIANEDSKIELTTFKQLYVEIQEEHVEGITEKLKEVGLEVHPAGFYTKSLITCNFCKGAEEAGLEIAKILDAAVSDQEVPSPLKIGYSGCALGTGEPLLKDIGVVKMLDKFDIYVGGEPKGLKAVTAQLFMAGLSEKQMVDAVQKLVQRFQNVGKKKEKFSKFIERLTLDSLRAEVEAAL